MAERIIFEKTYLVSGIMCLNMCMETIRYIIISQIKDCQKNSILPKDARLILNTKPCGVFGINSVMVTITTEGDFEVLDQESLSAQFEKAIDGQYEVIKNLEEKEEKSEKFNKTNWINIFLNLAAIAAIIILSLSFPPSIFLTIGLCTISFITTAYTGRKYLGDFISNLRALNLLNMSTTITLGWLFALAHTLFHTILMPLAGSFSMIFMSFIMPVMLITFINGMDEIKQKIFEKTKKMSLKGLKNLFPQMAKQYQCIPLKTEDQKLLNTLFETKNYFSIEPFLEKFKFEARSRKLLEEGMILEVEKGQCFPVDCLLLGQSILIDPSAVTGERQQLKQFGELIHAGTINLGQRIRVFSLKKPLNSMVNEVLLSANRGKIINTNPASQVSSQFSYLYIALIIAGLVAAVIIPAAFGVLSFSLIVLNVTGFLFSLCFCTVSIAHQLPSLVSVYHCSEKEIYLRDESMTSRTDKIETFIFDKTGTLTTGNAVVESSYNIDAEIWERIYLLEKHSGAEHPVARAIINFYDAHWNKESILFKNKNCIQNPTVDSKNRGLSAQIQGRQIHIGKANYLEEMKIEIPELSSNQKKQGLTAIYVAEDQVFKGIIYIKHEIRPGVESALRRLKSKGKKLILLTGDSLFAARAFNQQMGSIFDEEIYADKTPQEKEAFIDDLLKNPSIDPKKVCFVGDGLNDDLIARKVSEQGGLSCSMHINDKASYFTDVSLNGSLSYLIGQRKINQFLKKIILQNKGILIYSTVISLVFIISFSVVAVAVSPLIPLSLMLATTLMVLFNSYRIQLNIDATLDENASWPKKILSSDLSLYLLLGAGTLLIISLLMTTIATGGLAFPVLVFTAGIIATMSSVCTLASIILFSAFSLLAGSHFAVEIWTNIAKNNEKLPLINTIQLTQEKLGTSIELKGEENSFYCFGFAKTEEKEQHHYASINDSINLKTSSSLTH